MPDGVPGSSGQHEPAQAGLLPSHIGHEGPQLGPGDAAAVGQVAAVLADLAEALEHVVVDVGGQPLPFAQTRDHGSPLGQAHRHALELAGGDADRAAEHHVRQRAAEQAHAVQVAGQEEGGAVEVVAHGQAQGDGEAGQHAATHAVDGGPGGHGGHRVGAGEGGVVGEQLPLRPDPAGHEQHENGQQEVDGQHPAGAAHGGNGQPGGPAEHRGQGHHRQARTLLQHLVAEQGYDGGPPHGEPPEAENQQHRRGVGPRHATVGHATTPIALIALLLWSIRPYRGYT
ncbi:hypothetical protein [Kutzneria sp. 744]|uniref:hypothetical protein n=1 Tax=Kutzneria sp. (strain 744) TaxID=345341 RepID=UPI0005B9F4E7|nr:hypothetical protein [Kutzneria sp. 744]